MSSDNPKKAKRQKLSKNSGDVSENAPNSSNCKEASTLKSSKTSEGKVS